VHVLNRSLRSEEASQVAHSIYFRWPTFRESLLRGLDTAGGSKATFAADEEPMLRVGPGSFGPRISFPKFRFIYGSHPLEGRCSLSVCRGENNSKIWFRLIPTSDTHLALYDVRDFFQLANVLAEHVVEHLSQSYLQILQLHGVESLEPSLWLRMSAVRSDSEALSRFLSRPDYDTKGLEDEIYSSPALSNDIHTLAVLSGLDGTLPNLHPVDGRELCDTLQWWSVREDSEVGLYVGLLSKDGLQFVGLCIATATSAARLISGQSPTLARVTAQAAEWL
jgi:hypothetical protein